MASNFESGFSVGSAMWHGMGVVLRDAPRTMREAIVHAGMGWRVIEAPCEARASSGHIVVPDHKVLLRETDMAVLGVVSRQYQVLQNEDAFGWFDDLVRDGTCTLETAGSLSTGKKVWVQARYAKDMEVRDGDAVSPFLLLANGHDGNMSIRIINTPIRVVCQNTMSAAGAREDGDQADASGGGIAISHQGDIATKIRQARIAVVAMNQQLGMTIDRYREWAGVPVDERYVRMLAKEVFDQDYIKAKHLVDRFRHRQEFASVEIKEKVRQAIADLEAMLNTPGRIEEKVVEQFHSGAGSELAGETKWGAINAVTGYIDHVATSTAERRLSSSWFGEGARKRRLAHELVAGSR